MANFIGKIQIGANGPLTLIGSTAYGICDTSASMLVKVLTTSQNTSNDNGKYINSEYPDTPIVGSTIHIKFTQGNSVTTGVTLQIRNNENTSAPIIGMPICGENTVLSLTYDEYGDQNDPSYRWIVNDNVDTNTTYTFTSAQAAQPQSGAYFAVTPSSGTAEYVPIAGLEAGAYKDVAASSNPNASENDKLPTVSAVKEYITAATDALGVTGAMHFRGQVNALPDVTDSTAIANYHSGDVILLSSNDKEYIFVEGDSSATPPTDPEWIELGDESSYLLADSITDSPISVSGGATPTFGVRDGVLTITPGTDVAYSGPSQVYIPVSTTPSQSP